MRIWTVLIFLAVIYSSISKTDGSCELPTDMRGTWVDTFKGALTFEATRITGYVFHTFGTLTLTCYQKNDTVYVMESSDFQYYGMNFTAYFCWNFTQVNSDMFYFYEYGAPVPEAGDERVKIYLPLPVPRIYDSICSNPNVGLGTYRLLFRNGTITDAISDCPSEINGNYKYDIKDETGSSTCNSSSNAFDACSNTTSFLYNGTDCSIPLAYSESGSIYCLFNVEDTGSKIHYMSLYNPGDVDGSTTYMITCMILSYASSSLRATQYPKQCPDNMNTTYVTSPGAYVYLNSPSSCTASSVFPWWVIGVALALALLIALIIIYLYYRKKKQKEEERKRRLLEEDDERFDPDKFARGDRPPFVSITIMGDGRRRTKDGQLIDDEPPKIKRPKSEGGKRRLDKRKRVWVIDKDGKVKKVWKEEQESPDSGVEDDEVDGEGGGSTGRKTITSSATSEKDADDLDFTKKHGRKELKSAREIEEKGEKDKNSAKLKRKMKGMVSSRKSAKFRKSAKSRASARKKSAMYQDDDGERSWGSDDGDYEEVDVDKLQKEMDDNKLNEEREKLGEELVKPSKDEQDPVAPVAAVTIVKETASKDDGKGRKGKKSKDKSKKSKESKGDDGKKKAKKEGKASSDKEKLDKSTTNKGEELIDQPSTSGVVATAVIVDETAKEKKEKETSKKPQDKKKVETKQTKKATEKKVTTGKTGEQIEMEDKKGVTFRDGDGEKLPEADKTAVGAAVVATDVEKTDKSEAKLRAEQKKKVKEELKKQKEERKRQEREAKDARKKAEKEIVEKAKVTVKYESTEPIEDKSQIEKKEEAEIPKKDDEKPSGQDSGHVTPTSAEGLRKQDEKQIATKDSTKPTDVSSDRPPVPSSREPTLSSSMRPRREQSVLLDLDNSRSGSAGMGGEKSEHNAPPGQGEKALEVVAELVNTARNKAEGLDNTLDESMVTASAVPLLDLGSKDSERSTESATTNMARGDESKDVKKDAEVERQKEKTESTEKQRNVEGDKSKTGAKSTDKNISKGVQIKVDEADKYSKTNDSKRHDTIEEDEREDDESSEDSSEPDIPVIRRKKPQGFMFQDPSSTDSAFKTAGDILHTMPVKKKASKRKPRAAPVDIATTLPQRTNQAFGVGDKNKAKVAAVAKPKASRPATSSKGPMTIKDISKKPQEQQKQPEAEKSPSKGGAKSDTADGSRQSGQTTQRTADSKDRKSSEVDTGQHLKLMTRLMSLAEDRESEGAQSRTQSSKSRRSRLERAELSARARAEEAALIDGTFREPTESMETPDALLTARQGPILPGLPPTQHIYSRASSAGTRVRSGVARSQSDSRQAWVPNPDTIRTRDTHSSSSTNSEERFVRFKQGVMKQLEELGQQEMNAILYPRVQRYPEEERGGPKRMTPAYSSVGTLQRIHRKSNKVGPLDSELPPITGAYGRMIDDYDDADDPRLKVLLEELYKDKKYMDKTLRENPDENNFIRSRTMQGRSYLLNRARFWSNQQPLVRPGTQATSRASTAMPPPFPGECRTRSEERPSERKKE